MEEKAPAMAPVKLLVERLLSLLTE